MSYYVQKGQSGACSIEPWQHRKGKSRPVAAYHSTPNIQTHGHGHSFHTGTKLPTQEGTQGVIRQEPSRATCTLLRAGVTSVRAHCSSNKRGSACLLCRKWSQCLHLYKSIEQKAPSVPPCECGRPHVAGRNSNILLDLPSGLDPSVAWGGEEHGIVPHLRNPKVHQLRYMKPEREVGAIHSRDTYYALGTGEG